jgi:hypothetical protein
LAGPQAKRDRVARLGAHNSERTVPELRSLEVGRSTQMRGLVRLVGRRGDSLTGGDPGCAGEGARYSQRRNRQSCRPHRARPSESNELLHLLPFEVVDLSLIGDPGKPREFPTPFTAGTFEARLRTRRVGSGAAGVAGIAAAEGGSFRT